MCGLFALGWAPAVRAQLPAPLPSPNATVSQTVGVTKVEVVYSRPHVKGPARVAVVAAWTYEDWVANGE